MSTVYRTIKTKYENYQGDRFLFLTIAQKYAFSLMKKKKSEISKTNTDAKGEGFSKKNSFSYKMPTEVCLKWISIPHHPVLLLASLNTHANQYHHCRTRGITSVFTTRNWGDSCGGSILPPALPDLSLITLLRQQSSAVSAMEVSGRDCWTRLRQHTLTTHGWYADRTGSQTSYSLNKGQPRAY